MSYYGYIRVSAERQAKSQLGLSAQRAALLAHCRLLDLRATPIIYADEAVSASKHMLRKRPQGAALDAILLRGDHVVIAKLDRGFRNLSDFAATLEDWSARGIALHLLDVQVDTSLPVGRLIASVMAAVAQWESQRIGERIRDAQRIMLASGRAPNGHARLGYSLRGKRLVADQRERAVIRRIVGFRREGMLWREIAAKLAVEKVRTRDGRRWSKQRCWRGYMAYLRKYSLDPKEHV